MNRVKAPVGIEIFPPFLREKEEPLKRDNVFGCEAVKGVRSGCDKIAAAFIFHEKTVGHVFMGKVKMVGQGLAKHAVFIAEPDSKRRSGTAPVTLVKLKILAPVFRLFSEGIQRFVHYKSTGRHRFELVYGKIKLGTKKKRRDNRCRSPSSLHLSQAWCLSTPAHLCHYPWLYCGSRNL